MAKKRGDEDDCAQDTSSAGWRRWFTISSRGFWRRWLRLLGVIMSVTTFAAFVTSWQHHFSLIETRLDELKQAISEPVSVAYPLSAVSPDDGLVATFRGDQGMQVRTIRDEQFSLYCDNSLGGSSTVSYKWLKIGGNQGAMSISYSLRSGCGNPFAGVFVDFRTPPTFYDVCRFSKLCVRIRVCPNTRRNKVRVFAILADRSFPLRDDSWEKYSFPRYEFSYEKEELDTEFKTVSIHLSDFVTPDRLLGRNGCPHRLDLTCVYRLLFHIESPQPPQGKTGRIGVALPLDGVVDVSEIRFQR
jgi:hypothetical protein